MTASRHALLTCNEMTSADRATIAGGVEGFTLMRRAGVAVGKWIEEHYACCPVLVLAGMGNNGGDGFIAAQYLAQRNWPVRVALAGQSRDLRGDAALAAAYYSGDRVDFSLSALEGAGLVIDALFGTGLTRPVSGEIAQMVEQLSASGLPVVAVDMPSGICADSGTVRGVAVEAQATITFHRKKRGHVLMPGHRHCGEVTVADIGITAMTPEYCCENHPDLWRAYFPWPRMQWHKFMRGHAVVQGGGIAHTGAARLAAKSALRAGAGVVTLACDTEALPVYATALQAVMTRVVEQEQLWIELLQDERVTACLIGPAAGLQDEVRQRVLTALALKKPCVLDADALTLFARESEELFTAIGHTPVILTPHEGEFARLFPQEAQSGMDKISRACDAARHSGAVVVLKGADTVIAAPDGRVVVNVTATPHLATAGAGDVLAGIATGLLAARMPVFEAACAAVWLHGIAGQIFGVGLIASDLPDMLPAALRYLEELEYD